MRNLQSVCVLAGVLLIVGGLSGTSALLNGNAGAVEQQSSRPMTIQDIEGALEKTCPELDYPQTTPLPEILDYIETELHRETGLSIGFVFHHPELELEGVDDAGDIRIRDFYLPGGTHTFRAALDLIFSQTTDPELTYIERPGHVLVTTMIHAMSDDMLETRVFDFSAVDADIRLSVPTEGMPEGSQVSLTLPAKELWQTKGLSADQLQRLGTLITLQTHPVARWMDIDGEGGTIGVASNRLIIRQNPRALFLIRRLIQQMVEPDYRIERPAQAPMQTDAVTSDTANGHGVSVESITAISGWTVATILSLALLFGRLPRPVSPDDVLS